MPEAHRIGRYEVIKHLASGGMGKVYLARSFGLAGFERHVVVKMLDLPAAEDDPFVAMFLDEARVVGRMHHQHVAPAYELDCDEDGRYFLVMDYVHGQTAKAAWQRARELRIPLPLDFTVTVVAAAASALHYAHTLKARDGTSLEIVHRDVSLSNLMIGYDGAIKLIDFGIATAARRSAQTQVGHVKGKVAYMAPEQLFGGAIDRRTDVFALGVVLYELATMTRAFRESSDLETVERIRLGRFVPPAQVLPEFPPDLAHIIDAALAVDPLLRYQDADTLRCDLEAFGRRHRLVVGDAAVIPVMHALFDQRAEPWQASDRTSEVAIPFELRGRRPRVALGTPAEIYDAPTEKVVEPTIELVIAEELVTRPVEKEPLTEPVVKQPPPVPVSRALRPKAPVIGVSLASLAIIAIGIALVVARTPATFETQASAIALPPSPPAPIVTPLPEPPPPPAAPSVRIRFTTTPSDATVLLDGQRLGHTPYDGTVPRADGPHVIKIRRRGYVPQKLEVDLAADVTRDVQLVPVPDADAK